MTFTDVELEDEVRQISAEEREEVNRILPPEVAALLDDYPNSIIAASDIWNKPNFPAGYTPEFIDIYLVDSSDNPHIAIRNGKITGYTPLPEGQEPSVTLVDVDGKWGYVQIQDTVIVNHIEDINKPDVMVDNEKFEQALTEFLASK